MTGRFPLTCSSSSPPYIPRIQQPCRAGDLQEGAKRHGANFGGSTDHRPGAILTRLSIRSRRCYPRSSSCFSCSRSRQSRSGTDGPSSRPRSSWPHPGSGMASFSPPSSRAGLSLRATTSRAFPPDVGSCINRPATYRATAALGVITDVMIIGVPIPTVLSLHISRNKWSLLSLLVIRDQPTAA